MRLNRYLQEAKYDNKYIAENVIYPMLVKDCKGLDSDGSGEVLTDR